MASVDDIGIDLGTSNVVVYAKFKGVVFSEPAVVAVERDTRNVIAIGEDARKMVGRTPRSILAVRPLRDGSVGDFELTGSMLRYFMLRVVGKHLFARPRIVISVPSVVNEMERRSITACLFEAGARRTQVLDRPIAAAIGANLPITDPYGAMIVDIGAGLTDIAVLSRSSVMVSDICKTSGDAFDDAIIRFIRRKHNLIIGEVTAENVKISIGSAVKRQETLYMDVTGRDFLSGLPRTLEVTSDEITEAIEDPVQALVDAIHAVLERAPAELASDVFESGITLTGGGALLSGLPDAIYAGLNGTEVRMADNPQECVARGCGLALEDTVKWREFLSDGKKRL